MYVPLRYECMVQHASRERVGGFDRGDQVGRGTRLTEDGSEEPGVEGDACTGEITYDLCRLDGHGSEHVTTAHDAGGLLAGPGQQYAADVFEAWPRTVLVGEAEHRTPGLVGRDVVRLQIGHPGVGRPQAVEIDHSRRGDVEGDLAASGLDGAGGCDDAGGCRLVLQ